MNVKVLPGNVLKMTWNRDKKSRKMTSGRDKKSWKGEAEVEDFLGGRFFKNVLEW